MLCKMCGYIYLITNNVTGKIYVGKTKHSIEYLYSEHLKNARRGVRYVSYLYRAMQEYGIENFTVSQIEECPLEILDDRERFWIKKLNSQNPEIGYNIQEGGNGGAVRSKEFALTQKQLDALDAGRHLPSSAHHKEVISKVMHGKTVSEETREKLRKAQLGKKASEETKQELSEMRMGKKLPKRTETQKEHYKDSSKDRVHIHKGTQNKNPKRSEVEKYLEQGWELGYYYKA